MEAAQNREGYVSVNSVVSVVPLVDQTKKASSTVGLKRLATCSSRCGGYAKAVASSEMPQYDHHVNKRSTAVLSQFGVVGVQIVGMSLKRRSDFTRDKSSVSTRAPQTPRHGAERKTAGNGHNRHSAMGPGGIGLVTAPQPRVRSTGRWFRRHSCSSPERSRWRVGRPPP